MATPTRTGTIPTSTGQSTVIAGSADYQILMSEIQQTINKNDLLFKQIQQSNYPDAGSYSSDLLNYKINTQVTDLTTARQQIWEFLNKKYAENTKLRAYYFDELRKVEKHISDLTSQQNDIIDSIQGKELMTSTTSESIKQQKYLYEKMEYYQYLYKVILFVQIAILAVITLCITGIIPRATCLIITVILLIAAVAFVAYYVFFVNIGRSMFSWRKFEHDNSIANTDNQCVNKSTVSKSDMQKATADAAVAKLIIDQKSGSTCKIPTMAAVAVPTMAAVAVPTMAGVAVPTMAAVVVPTVAPTVAPTMAAVVVPSVAPTVAPTLAPTTTRTLT